MRSIQWARDNPGTATAIVALVAVAAIVAVVALRTDLLPARAAIVVGALALAGLSVYGGARQVERVQALLGATKADAGTLSPGFVRLDGTAEPAAPGGTVTSRHRDGEYVAYRYQRKEEQRRRRDWHERNRETQGPYKQETVTVDSETQIAPFRVEDGTGSVLVDADRVEMEIAWDEEPFLGGEGEYWAAVEPGDEISIYGRAMPARERGDTPVEELTSAVEGWSKDRVETAGPRAEEAAERIDDAMDAAREGIAEAGGRVGTVTEHAEDEDLILSRTAEDPFLLVTDRSGVRLVVGGVGRILAAVLLAAAFVAGAGLVAFEAVPLDGLLAGI